MVPLQIPGLHALGRSALLVSRYSSTRLRPPTLAALAIVVATLLELSRLVPIAAVDAFRLTFAGKILLGRYFSVKNIVAYVLAILVTAILDHFLLSRYWQDPAAPACDTL